jgi:hypothetical protein
MFDLRLQNETARFVACGKGPTGGSCFSRIDAGFPASDPLSYREYDSCKIQNGPFLDFRCNESEKKRICTSDFR